MLNTYLESKILEIATESAKIHKLLTLITKIV